MGCSLKSRQRDPGNLLGACDLRRRAELAGRFAIANGIPAQAPDRAGSAGPWAGVISLRHDRAAPAGSSPKAGELRALGPVQNVACWVSPGEGIVGVGVLPVGSLRTRTRTGRALHGAVQAGGLDVKRFGGRVLRSSSHAVTVPSSGSMVYDHAPSAGARFQSMGRTPWRTRGAHAPARDRWHWHAPA